MRDKGSAALRAQRQVATNRGGAGSKRMAMTEHIRELLQDEEFRQGDSWRKIELLPGAEVFRQGEVGAELYFIEQGTVRVLGRVPLDDARYVSPGVSDLGEGEVFGELVMFDNEPRSATVVCVTSCRLVAINAKHLMAHLERHPERGFTLLRALIATLVQRLRKSNQKIFSLLAWGLKAHQIDEHL